MAVSRLLSACRLVFVSRNYPHRTYRTPSQIQSVSLSRRIFCPFIEFSQTIKKPLKCSKVWQASPHPPSAPCAHSLTSQLKSPTRPRGVGVVVFIREQLLNLRLGRSLKSFSVTIVSCAKYPLVYLHVYRVRRPHGGRGAVVATSEGGSALHCTALHHLLMVMFGQTGKPRPPPSPSLFSLPDDRIHCSNRQCSCQSHRILFHFLRKFSELSFKRGIIFF